MSRWLSSKNPLNTKMTPDTTSTHTLWLNNLDMDMIDVDPVERFLEPTQSRGSAFTDEDSQPPVTEAPIITKRNKSTNAMPWRIKSMTSHQAKVIEQWISTNQNPTPEQKEQLLDGTSLTVTQLDGCLARAHQTRSISHKATKDKDSVKQEMLTDMLNAWSDIIRERQDIRDLSEGVPDTEDLGLLRRDYDKTLIWWLLGIGSHLAQASDERPSYDTRNDPCGPMSSWNVSSDNSEGLHSVQANHDALSLRKGGRLPTASRSPSVSDPTLQATKALFHCTMCNNFTSPSVNSWRRHELQQHVRRSSWICEPFKLNENGLPLCSFCDQKIGKHTCNHEVHKCLTTNDRAFQRREHLEGHLMRVHKLNANHAKRVSGVSKIDRDTDMNNVDLTCYFCGDVMPSWDERAKHVGEHYRKEASTKAQWDTSKAVMQASLLEGFGWE